MTCDNLEYNTHSVSLTDKLLSLVPTLLYICRFNYCSEVAIMSVAVVGAGVVGLTTAIHIQDMMPHVKVIGQCDCVFCVLLHVLTVVKYFHPAFLFTIFNY